jgi:DnaJ-class molecular chaperone
MTYNSDNVFDKVESFEICFKCKGNGYLASVEELQVPHPLKLCKLCEGNGYFKESNKKHGSSASIVVDLLTKLKELIRGKKYTRH